MPDSVQIRFARREDLDLVTEIEGAADQAFVPLFGPLPWKATPGTWRFGVPGFLLVAGDPVVGFAHVVELEGVAHLEQLAVRPEEQRRGTGTALVRAAREEAAARGYDAISLCTFTDVPWNGPFYARLGFEELTELAPVHRRIREKEVGLGLDGYGRRAVMRAPTRTASIKVTRE